MASYKKVEDKRPPLKFNFIYWEVFSALYTTCIHLYTYTAYTPCLICYFVILYYIIYYIKHFFLGHPVYFHCSWLTVNILAGAALIVTGVGPGLSRSQAEAAGQLESESSNLLPGKTPTMPDSALLPELEALRNFQEEFQLEDCELEKVVETILTQENSI